MARYAFLFFLPVLLLGICAALAHADKRVALVIGNGDYQHTARLPNPNNDAQDVAASLKRSGFETIIGLDLNRAGMEEATIEFARAARTADFAIFYYSGHAMQFAGVNYLIPVDAKLTDETDLRRMVRVDGIITDLQQAKTLRILVLDSCRDNPLADQFKRSIGASRALPMQDGLAKITSPEGMIISYATQAGRTADDGDGRNSPYTAAFLKHIDEKEEIGTIFRRITADVYETTRRRQLPELSLSLIGEFYLRGRQATVTPTPAAPDPCAAAESHWHSAEAIGTLSAYEDHLKRFANCAFAGLAAAHSEILKNKPPPIQSQNPGSGGAAANDDLKAAGRKVPANRYDPTPSPKPNHTLSTKTTSGPSSACSAHFYRCALNSGGRLDSKHPGCCWDLTL